MSNQDSNWNKVNHYKGTLDNAPLHDKVDLKKHNPYTGSLGTDPRPAKRYDLPPDYYGKKKKFKGAALAAIALRRSKPKPREKTPPRQKTPQREKSPVREKETIQKTPVRRVITPPPTARAQSPWHPSPEPVPVIPVAARRHTPPPTRRTRSPDPPKANYANTYRTTKPEPIFPPLVPPAYPDADLLIMSQNDATRKAYNSRFPMIHVSDSPRVELTSRDHYQDYHYSSAPVERYVDRRRERRYIDDELATLTYKEQRDYVPGYGSVGTILRSSRVYGY